MNWFTLSLISALGFGIIPLFLKAVQQTLPSQVVMAWYYSIVAVIMWIFVSVTTKITTPTKENIILLIVVSILAAIADLAIFYAYKLSSNAGYPRSIQAFSIIIATILSAVMYRQFPSTLGIVGTTFIFIGVVLLSGLK